MMKTKTPLWTSGEAAKATGGDNTRDWSASGISINTRTLKPGDLFVALVGPNADGHDHVSEAFEKGAVAACVSHRPPVFDPDTSLLMVDDTMKALEDLGMSSRSRFNGHMIAVTGSVGKTGTKEALNFVLADQGKTTATLGSLNNQWGLPLSLARIPSDAEYSIMELGMNHAGELAPLSKMTKPDVCLITTVQPAHTEFFENSEQIADAKAEIFQGAKPNWTAIINADIEETDRLTKAAEQQRVQTVIRFGKNLDADFRVIAYQLLATCSKVTVLTPQGCVYYTLASPGLHWVMNSLSVLAAVNAVGGDIFKAAAKLAQFTPPKSRGERFDVQMSNGAFTLIDESYNASPAAMNAAISVLGAQPKEDKSQKIAVLGDMLELGEDTVLRHGELAEALISSKIDSVYLAGEAMQTVWNLLPAEMHGHHSATSEMLGEIIKNAVRPGDVVMIKGSAGMRMGHIVNVLKMMDTTSERVKG